MSSFVNKISEFAGEIYSSGRWANPDSPGSARLEFLAERMSALGSLLQLRETEIGAYLVAVVESYEDALNDDWMPLEIYGLPLERAREFIYAVWNELQSGEPEAAVIRLRERYNQLALQ